MGLRFDVFNVLPPRLLDVRELFHGYGRPRVFTLSNRVPVWVGGEEERIINERERERMVGRGVVNE